MSETKSVGSEMGSGTRMKAFRLRDETVRQLEELARLACLTRTQVIERALGCAFEPCSVWRERNVPRALFALDRAKVQAAQDARKGVAR